MASHSSEASRDRSRRDAGHGIGRPVADASPISQTLQEQLATSRAETERFREQADARALELSELRALLGEAELRREETLHLRRQMRAQERLIAELRPRAASNKLALKALRRLQDLQEGGGLNDGGSPAPIPTSWLKAIERLVRGQPSHGRA